MSIQTFRFYYLWHTIFHNHFSYSRIKSEENAKNPAALSVFNLNAFEIIIIFYLLLLLLLNEYFNRIILQSYHTYTHIYTVISEVLHKKLYKKLKSRSIINNILKFKILKFKTLRSQKSNSQK